MKSNNNGNQRVAISVLSLPGKILRLRTLFFSFVLGFMLVACSARPVSITSSETAASPFPATPLPKATPIPSPSPVPPTATPLPTSTTTSDTIRVAEKGSWGKGRITAAEFSPDGKRLGVVTSLGIYFYDAQSLEQLDFIPNESDWPNVAFSPDWSLLAIGSGSNITLLRLKDKTEAAHIVTDQGKVAGLLFSPDGQYLAGLVRPSGEEVYSSILELWRMPDSKLLNTWKAGNLPFLVFTPDSKSIYVWYPITEGGTAQHWQIPSGQALRVENDIFPSAVNIGTDGNLVHSPKTNPDHSIILLGSVSDGTGYHTMTWSQGGFSGSLFYYPDGSLIIGLSSDGQAKVWRRKDGVFLRSFDISAAQPQLMDISPLGQTIVLLAWDGLVFYNLGTGKIEHRLQDHPGTIRQAAISPRKDQVAALFEDNDPEHIGLAVWSYPDGQLMYRLPNAGALRLAWSPTGDRLALAGLDGKIRILNAIDGQLMQTLSGHPQQVQSLAWSPDGSLIASGSFSVKVWRVSDGSLQSDLSGSGQWIESLHFSPDGKLLAGSEADGKVIVWQLSERKKINEIPVSAMGETSVVEFAPDGNLLAVAEKDRVWLYHLDEKQPFQQLPALPADVAALRISPDSQWLACALADGTIQVWQVPQGILQQTVQSGMSTVSNFDFSKDGKTLLAASRDGTIRFWEIQNIGAKR